MAEVNLTSSKSPPPLPGVRTVNAEEVVSIFAQAISELKKHLSAVERRVVQLEKESEGYKYPK